MGGASERGVERFDRDEACFGSGVSVTESRSGVVLLACAERGG